MRVEEILRRIRENKEKLEIYGVRKIGIFGSYARGETKENSDIDIIIEFSKDKKNFDNFINLAFFLEELSGSEIDLLTPESISPYMKPYIDKGKI